MPGSSVTSTRGLGAQTQLGRRGESPAVKERSLQTPQGCRRSHNSLPFPNVRSRDRAILGHPDLLSGEAQVPLPTWTQVIRDSNATSPAFLCGAAHLHVGSVPRSHTPVPQSMITPDARSPTLPGPPRAARSSPHFPKEVRSNSARPLAAQALTRQQRAAGGAGRGDGGRRRASSGGGHSAPRGIVSKIRPLGASRKQLMRPRLRSVTRMASQWRVEPEVPGWAAARDCHDCTNLPLETLQGTEPNSDLRQKRNWSAVAQADSVPNTDFGSTRELFSPPC